MSYHGDGTFNDEVFYVLHNFEALIRDPVLNAPE